jgi:hypothetical protein
VTTSHSTRQCAAAFMVVCFVWGRTWEEGERVAREVERRVDVKGNYVVQKVVTFEVDLCFIENGGK